MKKWWQDTIIYQVYLRSFYDSNNDGIGDIVGVIEKLDYLKDLGVQTVWISPHYDSPMDDNGYDVRDFFKVSEDYGTIEDFKRLLDEAHKRDMKIITDLVLNHTSDEHPWFLAAKDPNHPDYEKYHDYYIWHQGKKTNEGEIKRPTEWISWFGGPVWEYNEATKSYYLHIFSKKMPDLNWRNKAMREELKAMIKWWVDLGIDGFRVDASNHLEKNWDFPDAKPGYEHFSSLPKHHEYLEELGIEVFKPNDLMVVGEAGGATKKEALMYAGFDSNEFDMLIQFEHCWVDCDPYNTLTPGKWAKGTIDVARIKQSFAHWIEIFKGKGWNTIYWHNHDQPRIVSHYGSDHLTYREKSAKMLAMTLYLLPGTPIVYYGEEIGMTNVDYERLEDFRDVEVFTEYQNFIDNGASHEVAMQALRDRARDNARSPMQWDSTLHGGFSEFTPWMPTNHNYEIINVRRQLEEEDSILNLYKKLLKLRKEEALAHGDVTFIELEHPQSFNYKTKALHHTYIVLANFKDVPLTMALPKELSSYTLYLTNDLTKSNAQDDPNFAPF
ncbi:MAG: alpha-glucosidase, partial [Candidatus Izemoplasmataceae bacterium]